MDINKIESKLKTKKPVYFVFSNKDDIYYLKSMLRLNQKDFLYYQLKKADYKYIFIIQGVDQYFSVKVRDEDSYNKNDYELPQKTKNIAVEIIEKIRQKINNESFDNCMNSVWEKKENQSIFPIEMTIEDKLVFFEWLKTRLSKDKKDTAIVLDLTAFLVMWDSLTEEQKDTFINGITRENWGTLIITIPMEISVETVKSFTDATGCFNRLLMEGYNENIPEKMSFPNIIEKVKEQIIDLGDISREEVSFIIDNVLYDKLELIDENRHDDLVSFWEAWIHSGDFRRAMRKAKDEGIRFEGQGKDVVDNISRKELFEYINRNGTGIISDDFLRVFMGEVIFCERESLNSTIKQKYVKSKLEGLGELKASKIKIKIDALEKLELMEYMSTVDTDYDKDFMIIETTEDEWDKMRICLRDPIDSDYSEIWIEMIHDLCRKKNSDNSTYKRIMNCLMKSVGEIYTHNNEDEVKMIRSYIETSESCYKNYNNLVRLEKKINNIKTTGVNGPKLEENRRDVIFGHYNDDKEILKGEDSIWVRAFYQKDDNVNFYQSILNTIKEENEAASNILYKRKAINENKTEATRFTKEEARKKISGNK